MPNISARPQPSPVRDTRPRGGGAASSGASSPGRTAWSCRRASALPAWRSIRSTPSHGSIAATAIRVHTPIDTRQPAASASGTASSAGRIVPNCSTVMYRLLTGPIRSGK